MDGAAQTASRRAPEPRPLRITATVNADISFALQQNAVPILRDLRIQNNGDEPVRSLRVEVVADPAFCLPARSLIQHLDAHSTCRLETLALHLEAGFLGQLGEALRGQLRLSAWRDQDLLAEQAFDVRLLACDEWAGLQSLPEILAAFSQPNSPAVEQILRDAAGQLTAAGLPASIEGYQSGDPRRVWQITAALYSAIAGLRLTYANPPASFEQTGQKIRTPDRILDTRLATCLDLALLFASCLEQAGLNPLVILQKGHAYAGVWLTSQHFAQATGDDPQALRKRAQLDELLVFETTVVTGPAPAPFQVALDRGHEHLADDARFEMVLDIRQARAQRILPLPLLQPDGRMQTNESAAASAPAGLPEAPQNLATAPVAPDATDAATDAAMESPRDRVERWKRRLLDLSLRNRLLNWKETNSTLRLVCPSAEPLEAALAAGNRLRFLPLETLLRKDDPRHLPTLQHSTGQDHVREIAADALAQRQVLVDLPEKDLTDRLTKIYRSSVADLEEGGANTLFLAFGFLSWQQKEKSAKSLLAPILLVPVTLERPSIRHGFTLTRHDDEARVNPTLLQMLEQDFQLRIAGMDALPTQADPIDIPSVLRQFREAVRDIAGWEVRDDVALGLFSFAKYLMWKDLQDRLDDLQRNPVVASLIDSAHRAALDASAIPRPDELDDQCPPSQIFCPLIADSSQLAAVAAAGSGHSFVLDGPPGTGKSQTITNVIADSLAEGRRVLFVSEKLAALDVVQRRLRDIGLAPFCLQLHSAKAKRAEIVRQLAQTLAFAGQHPRLEWEQTADRLARLRSRLNGYVRELHRLHPNGYTVYGALSRVISGRGLPRCDFDWPDADEHDSAALQQFREYTASLAVLAEAAGEARADLRGLFHTGWSPAWESSFCEAIEMLDKAAQAFAPCAQLVQAALGLPAGPVSQAMGEALDGLAAALLEIPAEHGATAAALLAAELRAQTRAACALGQQRNRSWAALQNRYRPAALQLPLTDLSAAWLTASALWWPRSLFAQRRIRRQLAAARLDGAMPAPDQVLPDLEALAAVSRQDQAIQALPPALTGPLGTLWQGSATDWDRLTALAQWSERVESQCALLPLAEAERQRLLVHLATRSTRDLSSGSAALAPLLQQFRQAWQALATSRFDFEALVTCAPDGVWNDPATPDYAAHILARCARWRHARPRLRPWCAWNARKREAEAAGLTPLLLLLDSLACSPDRLADAFEYNYARWWLDRTVQRSELLRGFVGAEQNHLITGFRALDEEFTRLTRECIVARLAARLPHVHPDANSDSEMGVLAREINKQRGHLPLRRLISKIPHALARLTPCFLMSPLSVAQYLDAGHPPFDVVIFDEASQIPTWDAVGAMARGRQVVVAGDPRQLPPTNFFGRADDDSEPENDDVPSDLESILDECRATRIPSLSLLWHYRSRNESLIAFSNRRYYSNQLLTFPSPVNPDRAVQFHAVQGVYDRGASRTNPAEAEAVACFVIERLQPGQGGERLSIGVVTFNQQQQNLISNLLDRARGDNPELDALLSRDNPEPLFVKNLENVQGDERDIMVFSTTFGLDAAGKLSLNFGPLNLDGGERRLNVAVTRARVELHVFSSLQPDQIDLSKTRARGVEDLKVFLEYAQKGPQALVEAVQAPRNETESPFEEEVLRRLQQRGWTVHAQVGCSGYRIDLAVVDPRAPGRYLIGIECDGAMYHSAATARDRDRLRAMVLEGLGWRLHRIWSTDWWSDPDAQLVQLDAVLNRLLEDTPQVRPPQPPPASPASLATGPGIPSGPFTGAAAPAPALDPVASSDPTLPAYRAAVLARQPDQNEFYLPTADAVVRAAILQTIDAEGPIAATLLVRRISDVWGFQRSGTRIRSRVLELVPPSLRTTRNGEEVFYWPASLTPATWTGFRLPGPQPQDQRPLALVCPEELGNLVSYVVGQHAGVSEAQVVRDACRLLGMQRVTSQMEDCFQTVVKRLLRSGRMVLQAHSLILPQ